MVVFRLRCPMRSWIVRRSVPASSRCVANEWRSTCGVMVFVRPAAAPTRRQMR